MDEHADLLQTIAEIAVAFAGFSGVVAAFSRSRLHPRARYYRVRAMVGMGLIVLLFALAPIVLLKLGLAPRLGWRVASVGLGLAVIGVITWVRRSLAPLYRDGILQTQRTASLFFSLFGVGVIALIVTAFGPWVDATPAMYVTVLFLGLTVCAYYFFVLIAAIEFAEDGSEEGP